MSTSSTTWTSTSSQSGTQSDQAETQSGASYAFPYAAMITAENLPASAIQAAQIAANMAASIPTVMASDKE